MPSDTSENDSIFVLSIEEAFQIILDDIFSDHRIYSGIIVMKK